MGRFLRRDLHLLMKKRAGPRRRCTLPFLQRSSLAEGQSTKTEGAKPIRQPILEFPPDLWEFER